MNTHKSPWGAVLVVLVCLSLMPLTVSDYWISVLLDVLMWIALTESWIILSGYTGYISLGHSAFFGLGGYLMAMTFTQIPYLLGIALAGLTSAAFAFAIGFPFLRVKGPYFVILTLGLTELTKHIFINLEIKLGGTVGRIIMGAPGLHTLYYLVLIVAVLSTATAYLVKNSRFGIGLFSIKDNEEAAGALGINASLYKWLAFGISALFPGMIGAVLALRRSYIDPYTVFSLTVSFQVIVMAFLGGLEDVEGAVVGAVVLTIISELLWARYPYFYMIILGIIIIVLVKFLPLGVIFPIKQRIFVKVRKIE
jgi:branched-chain amino acid transport system permease protein